MKKAMLIMEMPGQCTECIAYHLSINGRICLAGKRKLPQKRGRPKWCPLKEFPEEDNKIGKK